MNYNHHHVHSSFYLCKNEQHGIVGKQKQTNKTNKTRNRNNSFIGMNNTTSSSMYNNNNNINISNNSHSNSNTSYQITNFAKILLQQKQYGNQMCFNSSYHQNPKQVNKVNVNHNKSKSFFENNEEQIQHVNYIEKMLNAYENMTKNNIHSNNNKNGVNDNSSNVMSKYTNFLNTTREYSVKGNNSGKKAKGKRMNSCGSDLCKKSKKELNSDKERKCMYSNKECPQYKVNYSDRNNHSEKKDKRIRKGSVTERHNNVVHKEFDWNLLQSPEEYHFMFVKLICKQKKDAKMFDNNNCKGSNNKCEFDWV